MTKKEFGGDLISQGKNEQATGGGAENSIPITTLPKLDKTTHLAFHIEGDFADQVDWHDWIAAALEGEAAKIVHGNVNTYYTKKKEEKKCNDSAGNKTK